MRKVKAYGRQSKNVVDLRDVVVGPKKTLVQTKAFKKADAIGKLDQKVQHQSAQTLNEPLVNLPTDLNTMLGNVKMNDRREKYGSTVGSRVKNAKLNSPIQTQFFKHKIVDN